MKDILNKALAANADTDAVAKVIDTVVNTPRQDAQSDTAIKRSLGVEKALAKRYKALQYAVADVIANAVYGHITIAQAADDIIKLVTARRIIDIEDYIWSAKTVHKLDDNADSAANANANHIVNVDAAGKGKDKSV